METTGTQPAFTKVDDAVIANLKKLAIQKFVSGLVRSMYTAEQLKIYKKSAKKGGTVAFPEDAKKYIKEIAELKFTEVLDEDVANGITETYVKAKKEKEKKIKEGKEEKVKEKKDKDAKK